MKSSHHVFVVVSLLAAVAAAGCSRRAVRAAEPGDADAPTVAAAEIQRGDIQQTLRIAAEFRPFQEIEVHAKVAGYLKVINVDVGDRVKAGELLAVLEIPELQDELRQDEASVKRATDEIGRAQADLERAQSAHQVAHLSSTRLAGVTKTRPNLVAQQDIDEAAGRDREAEAQVATAKAALASAQEQLEIAKATQNKTQTLLAYSRITAPFTGVITQRYADTGAMIQAGTSSQTQALPLVRLSQNDTLRLVIPVPESAVSRVHIGEAVDLDVQALHRTFQGTVARFADRLDSDTRTMRVEVDVKNPSLELVPGMYATASLVLDEARNAVLAPVQAIERDDKGARLYVVGQGGKVDVRPVAIGLESADRVQVTKGVSPGDVVVIGNHAQLKPGSVVVPKMTATAPAGGAE